MKPGVKINMTQAPVQGPVERHAEVLGEAEELKVESPRGPSAGLTCALARVIGTVAPTLRARR